MCLTLKLSNLFEAEQLHKHHKIKKKAPAEPSLSPVLHLQQKLRSSQIRKGIEVHLKKIEVVFHWAYLYCIKKTA